MTEGRSNFTIEEIPMLRILGKINSKEGISQGLCSAMIKFNRLTVSLEEQSAQ